jgi:hypothetical protein
MEHRGCVEGPDVCVALAQRLPTATRCARPPLQPFRSFLRRANADIRGLSCMLLPFFPLNPHLLGTASSCSPALTMPCPVRSRRWTAGVLFEELPRMAATDECAHRACLRMADVTVIHSVTTRATGLTATVMGRAVRLAAVSCRVEAALSSLPTLDMAAATCWQRCVCDKVLGAANVSSKWWGQAQLCMPSVRDTHPQKKQLPRESTLINSGTAMCSFNISGTRRVY